MAVESRARKSEMESRRVLVPCSFYPFRSPRFFRYRRSPILLTSHGEQRLSLFLMTFFCLLFKYHTTKIVSTLACYASPYARIERTQDESPRRHSRSAERGECVGSRRYY